MNLKRFTLITSICFILLFCGLICLEKTFASTVYIKMTSKEQASISIEDLNNMSVASFHIELEFDSENISNLKFVFASNLPAANLKDASIKNNVLDIYYVGTEELNDANRVVVGTIDFTRKDVDTDTNILVDLKQASIASLSHESNSVTTEIDNLKISSDSSSSGGSSSGGSSSGGSSSSSSSHGYVDKDDLEELYVENYMKENDELSSLAISLRTSNEDDDRVNNNIYELDEKVTYYIDFKNGGRDITDDVTIELELPLSFKSVESSGANVSTKNKTMTWKLDGLERDESGTIEVTVKYTSLGSSSTTYKIVTPVATIYSGKRKKDTSGVINQIVKDFDEEIKDEHEPYMRGDAAGTFRPDSTMTRAEAAIVLTRVFGININSYSKANFTDIDETYLEAQKAIAAASAHGLINGYPDGTYKPNQPMTRAEFITILARQVESVYEEGFEVKEDDELIKIYRRKSTIYDLSEFLDYGSEWANIYATSLVRLNLTPITERNRNLRLNDTITRAEVAQLINYYLFRTPASITSSTRVQFSDVFRNHDLYGDIVEATRDSHYYEYNSSLEEIAR